MKEKIKALVEFKTGTEGTVAKDEVIEVEAERSVLLVEQHQVAERVVAKVPTPGGV
jgi:hypothetical protein